MARCSKAPLIGLLGSLLLPTVTLAANTASVDFSAQISDGSCELTLSEPHLSYGVHRRSDVQASTTVMLLPLTAGIQCSGATTPTIKVSGVPYTPAPVSRAVIFRDADSAAKGVGFMVRRDTGGITTGNFFNTDAALVNGEAVTLSAVAEETLHSEPFLLGLVRAGNEPVTPGTIKATLTFTVAYE
ncbi:hypothetical protein Z042_20555 [Chania multitudinisentens RB-25]|uniref:Fimbrial-type adhesion domain-containing protein n=1 Tax=Chania multitudinisentens RB-25 TaxID=1441930 RepID=W0LI97_9GAMM|nr:fimbrial protein [Chania multitudinisentens]AHG21730.2 hypothetical protein Z042_20555 [Chania multitudinisentens RB-25]